MLLMCSFQKPGQTRLRALQSTIPEDVPAPECLDLDLDYYLGQYIDATLELKQTLMGIARVSIQVLTSSGHLELKLIFMFIGSGTDFYSPDSVYRPHYPRWMLH